MYNGFKNKETWTVNVHIQGTEAWYHHYKFISSLIDKTELAKLIKLDMEMIIPDDSCHLFRELITDVLSDVNWDEVASTFYE